MKTVKKSAAKKMVKKAAPKMMAKPAPKMPMQAPQEAAPMMKMGGKMPKAQFGKAMQNIGSKLTRATPLGMLAGKEAVNGMFGIKDKPAAPANSMMKKGGAVKKAKKGGSFPDLNKDGKITKADILKGRGVIAKKGASIKKCKSGCY